jgi:hypothetical protein
MAPSGFKPGGQTAPAGWASFEDASFPPLPPPAATMPAGRLGGGDFGCAGLPETPECNPICQCQCQPHSDSLAPSCVHAAGSIAW